MASKAKAVIALLMFWGVLGLIWATFYDVIETWITPNYAYALTDAATTWEIMHYIWLIGMPLIALGTGIAAISQKNQYSLGKAMLGNIVVMVCWFTTIMVWAIFYQTINQTIPNIMTAFGSYGSLNPATLKTIYNTGTVLFMVGMGVVGVSIEI